jgi:redox-sensitive bicupin YhaK (pirin superfamily)
MSGPVTVADVPAAAAEGTGAQPPCLQVTEDREASVGGLRVRRALPRRNRRTVGAWCFADHLGPAAVTPEGGLDIGPHPHIGLQTVTWLLDGEVLHRDSLGSEQVITPGQLNLMTAGGGVAHAEESTGGYRGDLHGIQLWVALPERTRHGAADFEHHTALPRIEIDRAVLSVLIGDFAGQSSPARHDTPLVGVDAALHDGTTTWPLRPEFEYALLVLTGAVGVGDRVIEPGLLAYLGEGRDEIALTDLGPDSRVMLLGGEPFESPLVMWWNFVGRSRDEIVAAYADWDSASDRFGSVASSLPRIPVEPPFWLSR